MIPLSLPRVSASVRTALALTLCALAVAWPAPVLGEGETIGAYLEVSPSGRRDLDALVSTLEQSLRSSPAPTGENPVVLILHGEEALAFTRENYAAHRMLADRVALLDAYRMVDVRMCETWMANNGLSREDLLPFVDTVPYAPEEVRRLEAEGYRAFGAVQL